MPFFGEAAIHIETPHSLDKGNDARLPFSLKLGKAKLLAAIYRRALKIAQ